MVEMTQIEKLSSRSETVGARTNNSLSRSVCTSCFVTSATRGWYLLDEFLGLEEPPQVEHLPRGQTQQAAHTKDAEEQHPIVGGLCE